MTTYSFSETSNTLFTFQPTLDGVVYNATLPWNIFGKRFYVNITDYAGNLILNLPLIESSTSIDADTKTGIESISWENGIVTLVPASGTESTSLLTTSPPGTIVNIIVSGVVSTGGSTLTKSIGFNGAFTSTISADNSALIYPLPVYPGTVKSLTTASVIESYPPINIIAGYFSDSVMYYFPDLNLIEVLP